MSNIPVWFDNNEYSSFLAESSILFEFNVPLQKEKVESKRKLRDFDRQTAIRRINLRRETLRDEARAKARGIQMGLGEGLSFIKQKLQANFLTKLEEARTPLKAEKRKIRPEVDPADRERDRKREERRQNSQESELKRIIIVKNTRRNKIEIIPKDDYNPDTHTVLKGRVKKIDKGNVTRRDLAHYSKMENFINTKTSIRLLGKIEKEEQEENKMKKQKKEKQETAETRSSPSSPPPAPRIRTPVDGKEITDPTSTFPDWDHETNQVLYSVPSVLSTISGGKIPSAITELIQNSRTLGDAVNRIMQEVSAQYPLLQQMKIVPSKPVVKTGKTLSTLGIKETTPVAMFTGVNGETKVGFSVKIGEQLNLVQQQEVPFLIYFSMASLPEKVSIEYFNFLLDDFILELKTQGMQIPMPERMLSQNPGQAKLEKERLKLEKFKTEKNKLISKCKNFIENYVNIPEVKTAILIEALTGNAKFDGGEGSAQILISAKKDGSDTNVIQLNANFFDMLSKTKDTDLQLKIEQTDNDFTNYLNSMLMPLNESFLDAVAELEKNKQALNNPMLFLQTMGMNIVNISFVKPLLYSDFSTQETDSYNIITINANTDKEQQIEIPVKRNYNPQGKEEKVIEKGLDNILREYFFINDYLVEQIKEGNIDLLDSLLFLEEEFNILNERNYRKEYDNYHSRPEQRANRSKRVLARRKLEDEGRVEKGDGNDVHHEDGNPQNNSDDNLSVMDKSKNRSMNEEHGAGFEGTDELLQNLVDQTPLANNPVKSKLAKYTEDRYVKKLKKK